MVKLVNKNRHRVPVFFHSQLNLKIGLVGGSFNPAHDGHIHITIEAKKRLQLDQIWWLVSPQNPLKSSIGMETITSRLDNAQLLTVNLPFVRVISPEINLPRNYTYETLKFLRSIIPFARFVWIMGADNMVQLSKWHRHREMTHLLPIAVIDRPGYSHKAIAAGRKFFKRRLTVSGMRYALRFRKNKLPAWCFIAGQKHNASATLIRSKIKKQKTL